MSTCFRHITTHSPSRTRYSYWWQHIIYATITWHDRVLRRAVNRQPGFRWRTRRAEKTSTHFKYLFFGFTSFLNYFWISMICLWKCDFLKSSPRIYLFRRPTMFNENLHGNTSFYSYQMNFENLRACMLTLSIETLVCSVIYTDCRWPLRPAD